MKKKCTNCSSEELIFCRTTCYMVSTLIFKGENYSKKNTFVDCFACEKCGYINMYAKDINKLK